MPPVAAIASAILPTIGAVASGVAGLAGAAASAVGSVASGILGAGAGLAGGAAKVVGGGISALTGAPAAGLTVAEQMAAIAEPAYYGLGVPAATTGVATGLSAITQAVGAGVGIYGQLAQIEMAKEMTEAQKIAAQKGLMEAEALKLYAATPKPSVPAPVAPTAPIPTLSQQPVYVTPAAALAAPNYLLYAGLAILAFLLLGKKIK